MIWYENGKLMLAKARCHEASHGIHRGGRSSRTNQSLRCVCEGSVVSLTNVVLHHSLVSCVCRIYHTGKTDKETRRGGVLTRSAAQRMTIMSDVGPDTPDIDVRVKCTICDRMLVSRRGLGQHVRLAHPVEYNNRVQEVTVSRGRWTDDERSALAALEVEAFCSGCRGTMDRSRYLAERHGGRSLESIRGERRQTIYKNAYLQQLEQLLKQLECEPISTTAMPNAETSEQDLGEVESPSTDPCTSTAEKPSTVEEVFEHNRNESYAQVEYDPSDELKREIEREIDFVGSKRKFLAADLVQGARAVLENRTNLGPMMEWFAKVAGRKRPQPVQRHGTGKHGPNSVRAQQSNRVKVRTEYAKLQTLFRRAPRKVAKCILDEGKNVKSGPKVKATFRFWENVLGSEGTTQGEEGNETSVNSLVTDDNVKAICGPIRPEELATSKPKRGTAAGPDGVTATRWRVVPEEWKMLFYNCILYAEELPKELVEARTVLIPKVDDPRHPSEFRPISITSVALRQLHTMMARRLQHAFAHDERQRAFQRSVDGSAENVLLLNAILKDARDNRKELHLVSLDLNKAFDSVHHKSVLSTLRHLGCPARFIDHVRRVYSVASTRLQYKGQEYYTQVKRGVLQGDPMSPILFNYVIDRALAHLNNSLGYSLGGRRISAIAFADDIVLVSGSVQGLQRNLDSVAKALGAHGLTLNVGKTSALSYKGFTSSKTRRMAVCTVRAFHYGNLPIRQLGPAEEWKYLGVCFRGVKSCGVVSTKLTNDVEKISRAKLKPQQKLLLLRQYVLPRHLHELVLGKTNQVMLGDIDKVIRKSTRKWLRLPHDVPISYIHTTNRFGGLGVFSLKLGIPRMRLSRIRGFIGKDSEMARVLGNSSYAQKQIKACEVVLRKAGVMKGTNQEVTESWKAQLEAKIDTKGLSCGDPVSHVWLKQYGSMSGGEFVRLNHLRAGCLPTAARLARGREGDTSCRGGCGATETNYHVIQQCELSKGMRQIRHNRVVELVCRALDGSMRVHKEPRFETTSGLKIPDIVAVRGHEAWVMDVQIVKGDDLPEYHLTKKQKYQNCNGLDDLICRRYRCTKVYHEPVTVSYKGVIHCDTARTLRNRCNVAERVLGGLTLLVLRGSYQNWACLKARFGGGTRRNPNIAQLQ